ncbi:MAG: hypothetical protein ACTSPY_07520 [Candidatus Helarchaeota archaeon]
MNNQMLIYASFILWIIVICTIFGIFFVLFPKYLKFKNRNNIQLSYCLVCICLGIGRIIFIFFDYYFTKLNLSIHGYYHDIWRIATLFHLAGFGFIFVVSEYAIFKGKDYFILLISYIVIIIISMFMPDLTMSQDLLTFAFLISLFIPISYLYLAIKLTGKTRFYILLMFIGVIIFALTYYILSVDVIEAISNLTGNPDTYLYIYLIIPIIQIFALISFGIGTNKIYFKKE